MMKRRFGIGAAFVALAILSFGGNGFAAESKKVRNAAKVYKWTFDDDVAGQPAKGFRTLAGTWTVAADKSAPSAPNVLAQTAKLGHRRFGVCVKTGRILKNFDASVEFKPISGRIDASGGIIFRFVNRKSYYVVRANALENNFRLYYYVNGRRIQIAGSTVAPPALGKWHTIKVSCRGEEIKCYLDGRLLITHRDSTYKEGLIGLWTKADAVTSFDDLVVVPKD